MKQNTKFLWIYIAILFSFALILILFAGLTQNNYQKEIEQQQTESAGVKQSLITLTDENQKLKDQVKKNKSEMEGLQNENAKLNSEKEILISSIGENREISQKLLDAYCLYKNGDTEAALKNLEAIDKNTLTVVQLTIYNTIIGE